MSLLTKTVHKNISLDDIRAIKDNGDIWQMLNPMYWTIDSYHDYDDYIKSAQIFTKEQRQLYAITLYLNDIEVGDGCDYFLYESSGFMWQDVLDGFNAFGMNEFTDNFQKLIDYFGGHCLLMIMKDNT